jgi:hypothetical protein
MAKRASVSQPDGKCHDLRSSVAKTRNQLDEAEKDLETLARFILDQQGPVSVEVATVLMLRGFLTLEDQ